MVLSGKLRILRHLDHEVVGGQRTSRRRPAQFSPLIDSMGETTVPSKPPSRIVVTPNDFAEDLRGFTFYGLE
jgi:hypothetical protein